MSRTEREIVERRLAGHVPALGHDTAGLPWAGREVTPSPFAGDTGSANPRLADALAARADDHELMDALAASRLLVAVVAVPTEVEQATASGLEADSRADMATVVLTAPDGERALPAFTSVEAMAAWDPAARPVPVTPVMAAQAAVEEQCAVVVLDLASPHRRVVRTSQVWALAQERHWAHAADDPVVRTALADVVEREADIVEISPWAGPGGALALTVTLSPGLSDAAVRTLTQAVADALAADDVRIRLDGVTLSLRSA